jgi:hypothetical protein
VRCDPSPRSRHVTTRAAAEGRLQTSPQLIQRLGGVPGDVGQHGRRCPPVLRRPRSRHCRRRRGPDARRGAAVVEQNVERSANSLTRDDRIGSRVGPQQRTRKGDGDLGRAGEWAQYFEGERVANNLNGQRSVLPRLTPTPRWFTPSRRQGGAGTSAPRIVAGSARPSIVEHDDFDPRSQGDASCIHAVQVGGVPREQPMS